MQHSQSSGRIQLEHRSATDAPIALEIAADVGGAVEIALRVLN
jgi:hypothetical protein